MVEERLKEILKRDYTDQKRKIPNSLRIRVGMKALKEKDEDEEEESESE